MKTLAYILKASLGIALIVYMIYSGKLDLRAIINVKDKLWLVAPAFFIILFAVTTTFYRWKILLAGQDIHCSNRDLVPMFFIGLFFSSILPGVVSGDIIKSAYIIKKAPEKKTSAVMTIILDRVIGLIGLMIICCFGFAINMDTVNSHSALKTIAFFMVLFLAALIVFSILGLSRRVSSSRLFNYLIDKMPFSRMARELYEAFHIYRDRRRRLAYALLISIVNHSLNIIGFFMLTRALGFEFLSLKSYLFIVPTGMLTAAIPITPAGIGIGQAAFLKLFEWSLGTTTTVGADAATIWQAMSISICMIGVYFYVTYRRTLKE